MALTIRMETDEVVLIDTLSVRFVAGLPPNAALFECSGGIQMILHSDTYCRISPGVHLSVAAASGPEAIKLLIEAVQPAVTRIDRAAAGLLIVPTKGNA